MLSVRELREVAEEAWEDIRATYPEWNMEPFNEIRITINHTKRVGGRARFDDYGRKEIVLSAYLEDREAADSTMRHEIAHHVAGLQHGHDSYWRSIAIQCGHSGERCGARLDATWKYTFECQTPGCGGLTGYHRDCQNRRLMHNHPEYFRCRRCNKSGTWKAA